jgi:hypothetical protein
MKAMATTANEPTKLDAHDGDPWSEMDIRDLTLAMKAGETVEEAASFLCRSGTVDGRSRQTRTLRLRALFDLLQLGHHDPELVRRFDVKVLDGLGHC